MAKKRRRRGFNWNKLPTMPPEAIVVKEDQAPERPALPELQWGSTIAAVFDDQRSPQPRAGSDSTKPPPS